MEEFAAERERPKTEIDGVIDSVCAEYDCQIKKLFGHLQDGKTWMFRPTVASGELPLQEFANEISERLNLLNVTHYVSIERPADSSTRMYIKIEPIDTSNE